MVILKNPLLIAFEKVVLLKTIHAAAIDLGLTQAAITKRIQALEAEIGVNLFLRSRRGMALTEEGTALLQYHNFIFSLKAVEDFPLKTVAFISHGKVKLTIL